MEIPEDTQEDIDNDISIIEDTSEEELSNVEEVLPDPTDFDCPNAGYYPSPTNCAQYYQCTADKTVSR